MSKNAKQHRKPTHEEIAIRAQSIYEREGRPQGRDMQHWLEAEMQLTAEIKVETSDPASKPAAKQTPAQAPKMRGNDWQTTTRQHLHTN